ncbi:MAG: type I-E CRISPR-associated endonuclease Cas1e [Dehalococcoidales bacterium]|nr:type I-E CRISPR-associated endonuclease Cas1e [Dehalococcoidales bacterium]
MLRGRLGLDTARIPESDRHGLMWLGRGNLTVEAGTLRFVTAGDGELPAGDYAIPFQMVSCLMLQPGTTVSHDALRLLARHGTGLVATGDGGVRLYASMPFGPDDSALARRQAALWAEGGEGRVDVARRMYAWRLGEIFPEADIAVLRGMEGHRARETYRRIAQQFGIDWKGRRYDRQDPGAADVPNQAVNHAATAVEAAAMVSVAVTGTIPQLGFIHEDSGLSFCLDIADLYRDSVTLPVAFAAARDAMAQGEKELERLVRHHARRVFKDAKLIQGMIDRIKSLLEEK